MRILIVNNNLHIGGVQKALVSLLWSIRGQYDVTLLLFYPDGKLLGTLPPEVKVICPDSGYRYLGMTKHDVQNHPGKRLGRSFFAAVTRLLGRDKATALMALGQKTLPEFDLAISYLHNGGDKAFYGGCNEFVLNHVRAKRKIAFLHCDWGKSGADTRYNAGLYARFDAIAACSQGCADAFCRANPDLRSRVSIVYNCHQYEYLRGQAEQVPIVMEPDRLNIVTVARLGKEKSVPRAVEAIAALGEDAGRIHYYVIGDGAEMPLLRMTIETHSLQSRVTLCGELENPYGYIRAADLLLIPSQSEAAPLVIGEAAALGTPVLSTRTSSAEEMIVTPGIGWVCENSVEGIAGALKHLLRSPEERNDVRCRLAQMDFNNALALEQFHRLTRQ